MNRPYHRFVFDAGRREFVGQFEAMYQAAEQEGFDSWFQEDLTRLDKVLSRALLEGYAFPRVLDIGCGKGAFTHLLYRPGGTVIGTDLSATAVARARAKYPDIDFRVATAEEALRDARELD